MVAFVVSLAVGVLVEDVVFESLSKVFEFADHDFEFLSLVDPHKGDLLVAHVDKFLTLLKTYS